MSHILLRIVEGARVALYRHETARPAELLPTGFSRHTCKNDSQNPISFLKT
ncbi:hypothetical protein [Xanthomonas vasicola]|uniref:hypothetical protein n=1 Tax=Xanthomonas vasicola TaxID=56459 RepID=UPI001620778C|nr:hypothetical protein [Xanthomonas vasicola]